MINNIKIENFQGHKNTELEFSPGVNVIVGISDSGKSAILRALNWVINNKPAGDSIKSNWGGDTTTTIKTNCNKISRCRTEKDNYYKIEDQELRAFGREVPEEIAKAINFSEINLQQQLDSPFLLSKSPAEVQRILNRIANLDQIDNCLSKVDLRKRRANSEITVVEKNDEKFKAELESLSPILEIEQVFYKIEKADEELNQKIKSSEDLFTLLNKIEDNSINSHYIDLKLKQSGLVDDLQFDFLKMQKKIEKFSSFQDCIIKIKDIEEKAKSYSEKLKSSGEIFNLNSELTANNYRGDTFVNLKTLVDKITRTNAKINSTGKMYAEVYKEYEELMPDVCPLCGKEIE